MPSVAKVQHYVPKFLLRNFGTGKKDRLHVFDKQTGQAFATNVRNVAAESRFYDFQFEGHTLTLEPSLADLESKARPIVQRILDEDSVAGLSLEDRTTLAVFFSIQFTRTPSFREQWRAIPTLLGDWFSRTGTDESQLSPAVKEYTRVPDDNETKMQTARFMQAAPEHFAPHFVDKAWVLLQTTRVDPFLLGDSPIALQNTIDAGPHRGNLGIAVEGIEIYFPLSPTRALALWCPSHEARLRDGLARAEQGRLAQVAPRLAAEYFRPVQEMLTAIDSGRPLTSTPDNVENFNALQVRYAERYVFSSVEDFKLAREMIAAHPDLRRGPRFTAG